MAFEDILGQEKALGAIRKALNNGKLAHAYLFVGPEGVGKRLSAVTLAKAMNCRSPRTDGDACEKCPSCVKVNTSNHADVVLIEPEGDANPIIKIDQIREMQKKLRFRPAEGGRRACILDSADLMNDQASNALLKTLEEAPAETHIFLITSRPHRLLATIQSRCQWVRFRPLSVENVSEILKRKKSIDSEKVPFLASLAGGSAGRSELLSSDVDFQSRLDCIRF
ncbi:MAG TPA: DNA polymerase III subunit delta', partial [Thermodesulfobacteriota bacterium]|nr:DNA polymerase III subunit delta' [Thermodesulfobacteriota bacterium]